MPRAAQIVLGAYSTMVNQIRDADIGNVGRLIQIPQFIEALIGDLCQEAINTLKREPTMLQLTGNFIIIGDIHGNLVDVFRILYTTMKHTHQSVRFVCLGDYVDRGGFSIEVMTFLLALKVQHPKQFFLLRGNHEFELVNSEYGFLEEIQATYGSSVLHTKFNCVFDYLPFAALLNNNVICLHGGVSPQLHNLAEFNRIDRPVSTYVANGLIQSLVWADPTPHYQYFTQSSRGEGYDFGSNALHEFLESNNLRLLIRGHSCVKKGIERFTNECVTVFSSSGYCGEGNFGGVLALYRNGDIKPFMYQPFVPLKRSECFFYLYRNNLPIATDIKPRIIKPSLSVRQLLLPMGRKQRSTSLHQRHRSLVETDFNDE